jgi:glycosyltransferase involved in cell wall biosynthesis
MNAAVELVSILIPSYKPRDFRACLTSALEQTWPNVEIIVSDDCKTEAIREICAEFAGQVAYVRNPNPGPLGHNNIRNLAALARGTYIKFLFDDDILHPFCVQHLVEALERHPGSALAFSPRKTIDENNREIALLDYFPGKGDKLLGHDELVRYMARRLVNPIGEFTTVLFRRADIFAADGAMELMTVEGNPWRGLTDVALFVHLLGKGPAVRVGETLSYFRVHQQSNSNENVNPEWFYVVADWKLLVDYAIAHRTLGLLDRLSAYARLIHLLRTWSRRSSQLRPQFQAVLRQIGDDIARGALPFWAALPLRALLPRQQPR